MLRSARASGPVRAVTAALLAGAPAAQLPPIPPPGFSAPPVVVVALQAPRVRSVVFAAPDGHLVALGGELQLRSATGTRTLARLGAGDDFAFIAVDGPANRALAGSLRTGKVSIVDLAAGVVVGTFPGPANAFDAVALGNGFGAQQIQPGVQGSHFQIA